MIFILNRRIFSKVFNLGRYRAESRKVCCFLNSSRVIENNSWMIKENSWLNWRWNWKIYPTLNCQPIDRFHWFFFYSLKISHASWDWPRPPPIICVRKYTILVCPIFLANFSGKILKNFGESFTTFEFLVKMAIFPRNLKVWRNSKNFFENVVCAKQHRPGPTVTSPRVWRARKIRGNKLFLVL